MSKFRGSAWLAVNTTVMSDAITSALTSATAVAVPQFLLLSGLKQAQLSEPHVSVPTEKLRLR